MNATATRGFFFAGLLAATVWATACASTSDREKSAVEMYDEAMSEANPSSAVGRAFRDCKIAAGKFRSVMQNYPGTDYAALAMLGMADCSYDDDRWADASASYRQFVDRYPTHREYPKALYRLAECYYNQHDDYDLELSNIRNALTYYSMFIQHFPEHRLAKDAAERYNAARAQLAQHELYIVEHYLRDNSYGPAYERLQRIVSQYPNTPQAETAQRLLRDVAEKVGLPSSPAVDSH